MTSNLTRTFALALVVCAAVPAQAAGRLEARLQAAVGKVQDACAADLKQFCSTVSPGGGRQLLCLEAHEDKISTKCDFALFEASRHLERALDTVELVADACWPDIQKSCADVPPGAGNILACLSSKSSGLSRACQHVMSRLPAAGP